MSPVIQFIVQSNKDYTTKVRIGWEFFKFFFEASVNIIPHLAFFTIQTALHASLASAQKGIKLEHKLGGFFGTRLLSASVTLPETTYINSDTCKIRNREQRYFLIEKL